MSVRVGPHCCESGRGWRLSAAVVLLASLALIDCGGKSTSTARGGSAHDAGGAGGTTRSGGALETGGSGTGGIIVPVTGGAPQAGGATAAGGAVAETGGAAGVGPDLEPDSWKISLTVCEALTRCFGAIADAAFRGAPCASGEGRVLSNNEFSLISGAIARGTIIDTRSKLAACLASMSTLSCTEIQSRNLCADVFPGTVPEGGACIFSGECVTGTFCSVGTACPGTCAPLLGLGSTCEQSSDCQVGLVCDRTSKTCQPQLLIDVSAADGDSCDPSTLKLCQVGLSCALVSLTGTTPVYRCEAPPTDGSCHLGLPEECPQGHYCSVGGGLVGTCNTLPGPQQPCGQVTTAPATACSDVAICDPASGNCTTIKGTGAPCTADDQCYSALCIGGVCLPARCAGQ